MPESLIFVLSSLNSMLSNVLNSQRDRTRIIGCFLNFFFRLMPYHSISIHSVLREGTSNSKHQSD